MSDGTNDEAEETSATEQSTDETIGTPLGDEAGVYIPSEKFEEASEPPIDFGGFIVSLSTSCMVNLGHVENPETGERSPIDLPAAQQTIEILKLLRHKTEGNLEPEEERLIDQLINDTQLAYQKAKKKVEESS